ncbi:hypothetical protein [Citrobacter koseri]|uniref:hypothetical protein n=1 Tax=Citrobacter koseri TaxID=545 RepID=UPI001DFE311D|nr:hypothetical protein [Citrobacter koseri]CAG0264972.1 hypothetical protein AN2353V1_2750 [Citrobacter koseri]CAH6101078.1 hypothetical protein AN2353V1_2750 [Citrobacter koseri]
MALAPLNKVNEMLEMLTSHIDERRELDTFTLKRVVTSASKVPDEPTKLMLLALAHGAAFKHEDAVGFFREAVAYRDETVARNYLSYLSHTGQYAMYRKEAVRLAKDITSLSLFVRARNAAYADGNGELSLFFARKAITMIGDNSERERMELEVSSKSQALDRFLDATGLSTSEMSTLTLSVVAVAKKHEVLAVSHDYYTSADGDAAIICDVICDDDELISDMDIEVATELAMNGLFAEKNVTAWFRGRIRSEAYTL